MINFTVGLDDENFWRIIVEWGRRLIWLPFRYQSRKEAEQEISRLVRDEKKAVNNIEQPEEFAREWLKFWEDGEE